MIQIKNKSNCCGCSACFNACPVNAISMLADNEGFLYPKVNKELCTDCGICVEACPMLDFDKKVNTLSSPQVYAGWNLNEEIRYKSSSGGIFSALAESVVLQNGYVIGAVFNSKLELNHTIIDNSNSLEQMRGSKYVQSNINETYKRTLQLLKAKETVLFSGTPCQIAGLNTFLSGKSFDNLLTVEVICHGTPSQKTFEEYIKEVEEKEKEKVTDINFRDKTNGWKNYLQRFSFKGSHKTVNARQTSYMQGFLKNLFIRPSCHECPFRCMPRVADISLGDYWGISNFYPELDNDKGTSLILINSAKGKHHFDKIEEQIFSQKTDIESAIKGNPCLVKQVTPNRNRESFFLETESKDFSLTIAKLLPKPGIAKRVMRKAKKQVNSFRKKIQ